MIRLSAFADEISQNPVEQVDVLCRARHQVHRIPRDSRDQRPRPVREPARRLSRPAAVAWIRLERDRLADRQDPDHRAVRGAPRSGSTWPWSWPTSTRRLGSASSASTCRRATTRPRTATAVLSRMAELTRRAAARGITLILENEKGIYGDTARASGRRARVGRLAVLDPRVRPGQLPRSRAVDRRGLVAAASACQALSRQGLRREDPPQRPRRRRRRPDPPAARGCRRRGYDGFCVLEPHLVVAEKSFGFTGPERFADAANALKKILRQASIAFA